MDFTAIPRPAFGRSAQHIADTPTPARIRAMSRYQRAAKTAAELFPELPLPGESIHALMTGEYDLCQVVTALVARQATIHVRIATLCYSKRNACDLLTLLEAQPELRLTLLVSSFFKDHNKELHEAFCDDLNEYPNAKVAHARSHCKVVCLDWGQDDGLVLEGSANLRTNKNREQLTAIRDRQLHDWHAAWIDGLVTGNG